MKYLVSTFTCILLLAVTSPGIDYIGVESPTKGVDFIDTPGEIAVVNLKTKFKTTVTLKWRGFTGGTHFRRILISTIPPSPTGEFGEAHILAEIAAWKTSCVVNGLAPGTYYWATRKVGHEGIRGPRISDVWRIVVHPAPGQ